MCGRVLMQHGVALERLPLLDVGMLLRLKALADEAGKAYEALQPNKVVLPLLQPALLPLRLPLLNCPFCVCYFLGPSEAVCMCCMQLIYVLYI